MAKKKKQLEGQVNFANDTIRQHFSSSSPHLQLCKGKTQSQRILGQCKHFVLLLKPDSDELKINEHFHQVNV